ncbi:enoyl-CoA hydratase/isomerase family protein [Aliirhizobium cellulosilyticum]|jgi:enoyl-CoA hydratase|uniref:3-hydroxyisobutyryl-CoA hydrolase n=1 Tax=Aliirhizobium cellulosilyticum TaxID=393664 RepID=A0A7W6WMZ7_9HYPH|nr:enoyl-CoA hydratase/isomerase family protein [Rhizobium cellulosilyticum]MBB4346546.1 enoyl-CoA hydratase [Rhizobium cellulosilyticum]MBB4411060.1 enoyl-CoA hydratase [Rhizobium cellulosilyticum]MBB4445749.1 enoyl-CoA hydratase [Rhizobium cellulosilyticum]
MSDSAVQTDEILFGRIGSAAIIRLNRPKALNSLNLAMVHAMKPAMERFAGSPEISCVILMGEGERGLCAGGDIRAIYQLGKAHDPEVTRFWREEFPINYTIARYPKPYVAVMDGIVMGGGVGVASHGKHRIVTERTKLAMPETGIGYVPDVGATWLLPRAPGEAGTWMGLTGEVVGAADAIYAGFADYHVPSEQLGAMTEALSALRAGASDADVAAVIGRFSTAPGESRLEGQRALIDRVFSFDTIEEILAALDREEGDFAEFTRGVIAKRSPTSLKLTLRLLRAGRKSSSLVECLEREFTVASELLRNRDFYEGVRAAVIDKDRNPQWQPATLSEVTEAELDRYFVGGHAPLFADHRL